MAEPPSTEDWPPLGWNGTAPFFPLNNVSLLPHALLPLHIFEPRYRKMTADVLAGDRLLTMAMIDPSWRPTPGGLEHSPPSVLPTMGIGRVVAHEHLPDGRYYIALKGLARVRLMEELAVDEPYRVGRFEVITSTSHFAGPDESAAKTRLLGLFREAFALSQNHLDLIPVIEQQQHLGDACDVLAAALPLASGLLQKLLEESQIERRAEHLESLLHELVRRNAVAPATRTFPPKFSQN